MWYSHQLTNRLSLIVLFFFLLFFIHCLFVEDAYARAIRSYARTFQIKSWETPPSFAWFLIDNTRRMLIQLFVIYFLHFFFRFAWLPDLWDFDRWPKNKMRWSVFGWLVFNKYFGCLVPVCLFFMLHVGMLEYAWNFVRTIRVVTHEFVRIFRNICK